MERIKENFIDNYCSTHNSIPASEINNKDQNPFVVDEKKQDLKTALQNIKLKQKLGNFVDKTEGRRYQKLQKVNFKMLNDLAVILPENENSKQQQQDLFQQVKSEPTFLEKLNRICPPFNPSSRIKLVWDILQMLGNICILFILPVHLVFQIDLLKLLPKFVIQYIIPSSLILDIIVNINTACFHKGVLIMKRMIILEHYFQNNFKYDIFANVPLLLYFFCYVETSPNENYNFWRFIVLSYFYKVGQYHQIFKRVEDLFPLSTYTSNLISLVKLLFSIVLNLHISALIWLFTAFYQMKMGETNTWLQAANIDTAMWYKQYIYSYYFSTVTMITVGYGDIYPKTVIEKLLSIVNMMIACGQFAYSVNSIGNIFEQFFKLSNEIKANMYIINNFMTNKNISKDLQYQVREYLEFYWKEEKASNTDSEVKILNQLSHKLKDTLLMEANKIALRDSPIFSQNFSDTVVQKTLPLIKEIRCTPEEIIFLKGELNDSSIYFIEKGCIEAFTYQKSPFNKKTKTINSLYTLGQGNFFGAHNFFTGESRDINIRSIEFTTLLKVVRSDFINLLKNHPDDYEIFCMIKDKALHNSESSKIGQCSCCNQYDHTLPLCPLIHYVPSKFNVIRQFSQGRDQVRQKTILKKRRKKMGNTRINSFDYQLKLEDYFNENFEDIKAFQRKYFISNMGTNNSIPSNPEFSDDYDSNSYDDDYTSESNSQKSKQSQSGSQIYRNGLAGLKKFSGTNLLIPIMQNQSESLKIDDQNLINNQSSFLNQNIQQTQTLKKLSLQSQSNNQENEENTLQNQQTLENKQNSESQNIINQGFIRDSKRKISKKTTIKMNQSVSQQAVLESISQIVNYNKQDLLMQSIQKLRNQQNQQTQPTINTMKRGSIDIGKVLVDLLHNNKQQQQFQVTNNNNSQNSINTINSNQKQVHNKRGGSGQKLSSSMQIDLNNNNNTLTELGQKRNQMIQKEYGSTQMGVNSFHQIQGFYQESLEDVMRIYKFYYPQHNLTNIIENIIEKEKLKREEIKKKNETQFLEQLEENVLIKKRIKDPAQKQKSNPSKLARFTTSKRDSNRASQISNAQTLTIKLQRKKSIFNVSQKKITSSSSSDQDQSQDLNKIPSARQKSLSKIQSSPPQNPQKSSFLFVKENGGSLDMCLEIIKPKVESLLILAKQNDETNLDKNSEYEIEGEAPIQYIQDLQDQSNSFAYCRNTKYQIKSNQEYEFEGLNENSGIINKNDMNDSYNSQINQIKIFKDLNFTNMNDLMNSNIIQSDNTPNQF